jgi:hypothetical protein
LEINVLLFAWVSMDLNPPILSFLLMLD